ncbi:MAG TPA: DUF2279 domain-containing protein [Thermoanaerobaculia bacterium]
MAGRKTRTGLCAALALASIGVCAPAAIAESPGEDLFGGGDVFARFSEPRDRDLTLAAAAPAAWRAAFGSEDSGGDEPAPAPAPMPLPKHALLSGKTLYLTLGVFASIPVVGELVWWKGNEKGKFHFTDEEWFQHDTYAGGADKASHFFFGYMFTRELAKWYERFGNTSAESRGLAAAVSVIGGALVELGDGFTDIYGYSWQDVAANATGALAAYGIEAAGISDVVGFRFGFVNADIPPPCCRAYGYGHDYSEDVYSADLKLEGVLRRAGMRPGPARFFLVSMTYGSKGYRFSPVDVRERNIGVDLGLNMPEILLAVGVPKTKWWGEALLTIFEYIRFPYTAFGWQYDLNHHKWHGPSTGNKFDPGEVIYP